MVAFEPSLILHAPFFSSSSSSSSSLSLLLLLPPSQPFRRENSSFALFSPSLSPAPSPPLLSSIPSRPPISESAGTVVSWKSCRQPVSLAVVGLSSPTHLKYFCLLCPSVEPVCNLPTFIVVSLCTSQPNCSSPFSTGSYRIRRFRNEKRITRSLSEILTYTVLNWCLC